MMKIITLFGYNIYMKKIKIIAILLMTFCLLSCKKKEELKMFKKTSVNSGFDTFIELISYEKNQKEFDEKFEIVTKDFTKYHQLFDIYHNYENINNLKTINDKAGLEAIKVDDEIINLLKQAKELYDVTGKVFDVSCGSVLKIYHDYRDKGLEKNAKGELGDIPNEEVLKNAYNYCGFKYLDINEKEKTVFLKDKHVSIDVGGLAKGYATEQIAKKLKNEGVENAVLNAGGNLKILGNKIDGSFWKTGITDPSQKVPSLLNFNTKENSTIVTSGNYQNFYVGKNKEKIHHIIDFTKTLKPAQYFDSVTIITTDSGLADGISTTLFCLPYEKAIKLIPILEKKFNIKIDAVFASQKKIDEHSILSNDYYINYTDGLKELIIQ